MATPHQPYRPAPGAEPPALTGRDGELGAANHAIEMARLGETPQPVVFTGLRGMGKTVLLRRAVKEARTRRALVVFAEASRATPLLGELRRSLERARRDAEGVAQRLTRAVSRALEALPDASFELPDRLGAVRVSPKRRRSSHAPLMTALEDLNEAVRREGRFLVIALDEVQEGDLADLTTVITFVHEMAGSGEPVLFFGAGLPNSPSRLHDAKTYTERWKYLRLPLLTSGEAARAIAQPAHEFGVRFEHAALQRLVDAAGGYPYFVQEYASAAWTHRRGKTIGVREVDAILPGVRRTLESSLYEQRFQRISSRESAFVIALAELGEGEHAIGDVADRLSVTSEHVSSIRQSLVRKEVIISAAPGIVEFRIPLSASFVLSHRADFEKRMRARRWFSPLALRSAAG
jgi:hypothetical protein